MSNGSKGLAMILYLGSIAMIVWGLVTTFYYPDPTLYEYSFGESEEGVAYNHIVEGDAYNFIIMAGRGIVLVLLGGLLGLIGTLVNMFGILTYKGQYENTITQEGKTI